MWRCLLTLLISTNLVLSLAARAKADPGVALAPDALGILRTTAESGSYTVAEGVTLRLGVRTEARLFARSQDLPLVRGSVIKTWTVIVLAGTVEAEVPTNLRRAVLIHDPDRRGAICLGGRVIIGTRDGQTSVANAEGSSIAMVKGRLSDLPSGSLLAFEDAESPATRHQLVAARAVTLPSALWLAPNGVAKIEGIRFDRVPGASHYELTIRPAAGAGPIRRLVTSDAAAGFHLDLAPGRYLASLRTLTVLGMPSAASPDVLLRVVGVSLPEGASVDARGRIQMAESQKLNFTDAEGLMLTSTGSTRSKPATSPVGLFKNQFTAVALHRPGSPDMAVAQLVPRRLSAEVFAGPKFATWPADPIQIAIELHGDLGRESLSRLGTKVTLGQELVAVTWREEGGRLIGTVQPQILTAPSVLRVEVTDQQGAPLGRDFVELIASPQKTKPHATLSVATR